MGLGERLKPTMYLEGVAECVLCHLPAQGRSRAPAALARNKSQNFIYVCPTCYPEARGLGPACLGPSCTAMRLGSTPLRQDLMGPPVPHPIFFPHYENDDIGETMGSWLRATYYGYASKMPIPKMEEARAPIVALDSVRIDDIQHYGELSKTKWEEVVAASSERETEEGGTVIILAGGLAAHTVLAAWNKQTHAGGRPYSVRVLARPGPAWQNVHSEVRGWAHALLHLDALSSGHGWTLLLGPDTLPGAGNAGAILQQWASTVRPRTDGKYPAFVAGGWPSGAFSGHIIFFPCDEQAPAVGQGSDALLKGAAEGARNPCPTEAGFGCIPDLHQRDQHSVLSRLQLWGTPLGEFLPVSHPQAAAVLGLLLATFGQKGLRPAASLPLFCAQLGPAARAFLESHGVGGGGDVPLSVGGALRCLNHMVGGRIAEGVFMPADHLCRRIRPNGTIYMDVPQDPMKQLRAAAHEQRRTIGRARPAPPRGDGHYMDQPAAPGVLAAGHGTYANPADGPSPEGRDVGHARYGH